MTNVEQVVLHLSGGIVRPDESIVLLNTGSGQKYIECFGSA